MKFIKTLILTIILLVSCAALALVIFMRTDVTESLSASPEPTPSATPTPTPTPEPEYFTISFVGDNTLSSSNINSSFTNTVKDDMSYPYANTIEYFEDDDLTVANLECVFSDKKLSSIEQFSFRAPTSYAEILVKGSVEFVSLANNHSADFGQQGYDDTKDALDEFDIKYAGDDETAIYETESGLKVGLYCSHKSASVDNVESAIDKLKEDGAEYIICVMHWGEEGKYSPNDKQEEIAHAAIDAGANVVYGSHPHVLQPVEEYKDGIIMYSLGNWSFGGNTLPRDMDTAIVQVKVMRDVDGTVITDSFELIPCRMSSTTSVNDFCPTPYDKTEDKKAYDRTMSKLDGSFDGSDLSIDYSFLNN